ncbi:MAG: hypothetical protein ACI9TV_002563 [Sulfurimonas sp.]|jgi:hypothetical protein|uniref:hypothetical protein n=1 Tax=Sulfurimonas sp. TaxID=2022749 RepID=UPI0039E4C0E1
MDNKTNDTAAAEVDNVDQIREILFGSQTREVNDKFDKIEQSIKSIHDEMRSKLEQSQNDMDERINTEVGNITKKIKNITIQQQEDLADTKDTSLKLEKRLQNSMEVIEEELNTKREQLHKQQIEMRNTLRAQMDSLQDELLSVLDKKISTTNEVKLSRDDAAEILMEAAMAMKGTKINTQLSLATKDSK